VAAAFAAASAASSSADFITVGAPIAATVKSRVIVGLTPSGSLIALMCTESLISRPVRSTSISPGIVLIVQ